MASKRCPEHNNLKSKLCLSIFALIASVGLVAFAYWRYDCLYGWMNQENEILYSMREWRADVSLVGTAMGLANFFFVLLPTIVTCLKIRTCVECRMLNREPEITVLASMDQLVASAVKTEKQEFHVIAHEVQPQGLVCQVCGEGVGEREIVKCEKCETPHHRDCWDYAGQCSTFGCGSKGSRTQDRLSAGN